MPSTLDRHAEQLAALGHPVRLAILRFVVQGGDNGIAAGEIQSHVDLPASTLSHHLKRLVDAGTITSRPEGTLTSCSARLFGLDPRASRFGAAGQRVRRHFRSARRHLGVCSATAVGYAIRCRRLHHGGILVHVIHFIRESSRDARQSSEQHLCRNSPC